jgi:hypothetical protein
MHFAVAAYIIMNKRFKRFIIPVEPFNIRTLTSNSYHLMCFPILFLFRNKSAAFQNQNSLAARCKFLSHCASPAAGADDDYVIMIAHIKFYVLCFCSKLVAQGWQLLMQQKMK